MSAGDSNLRPPTPSDSGLVRTIYAPPRASEPWPVVDELPRGGVVTFHSLGRWALLDALRASGVKPGDVVLLPELICREVLASVNVIGATPSFYPVTPQLSADFTVERVGRARAVIAVNYFGFPQCLDAFQEYCRQTGAALIEDNAHGFLSCDEDGRVLGGRGDAGIFSFRKTIPVPEGAALVLMRGQQIAEPLAHPPSEPGVHYRGKQAFRGIAGHLAPRQTCGVINVARAIRHAVTGVSVRPGDADAEIRIPGDPAAPAMLSRGITIADPDQEVRRRRALYELAATVVTEGGAVPVFPHLPRNVVPYGFPAFVAPGLRAAFEASVRRRGMQLATWPDLPAAVAPSAPEHYRNLMVLPFLW